MSDSEAALNVSQGSFTSRRLEPALYSPTFPQFGEDFEAGVAVGGDEAGLGLELAHRDHGVAADAAIGAAGVEALCGQAALRFLDFFEREDALAAYERLREGWFAADAVAEVHDGQRVGVGGDADFVGPSFAAPVFAALG